MPPALEIVFRQGVFIVGTSPSGGFSVPVVYDSSTKWMCWQDESRELRTLVAMLSGCEAIRRVLGDDLSAHNSASRPLGVPCS